VYIRCSSRFETCSQSLKKALGNKDNLLNRGKHFLRGARRTEHGTEAQGMRVSKRGAPRSFWCLQWHGWTVPSPSHLEHPGCSKPRFVVHLARWCQNSVCSAPPGCGFPPLFRSIDLLPAQVHLKRHSITAFAKLENVNHHHAPVQRHAHPWNELDSKNIPTHSQLYVQVYAEFPACCDREYHGARAKVLILCAHCSNRQTQHNRTGQYSNLALKTLG
jgi:hypothetical protein